MAEAPKRQFGAVFLLVLRAGAWRLRARQVASGGTVNARPQLRSRRVRSAGGLCDDSEWRVAAYVRYKGKRPVSSCFLTAPARQSSDFGKPMSACVTRGVLPPPQRWATRHPSKPMAVPNVARCLARSWDTLSSCQVESFLGAGCNFEPSMRDALSSTSFLSRLTRPASFAPQCRRR